MKKIRLLALLVLGFVATTAMAQNLRVSGVVKSSEDGQTIPGAFVIVKGAAATNGTATNGEGAYTLNNVPSNGVLEFRYAGMKPIDIQVNGRTTINVTMEPSTVEAQKVTVTALGVRKQNRALGYAATTVGGSELARTNTISPINALQGKVAGVNIATSGSGGVTTSPTITIRGAKSLTKNNSPIFVIDGIVMQNVEQGKGNSSSSDDALYGNQLKNLNPDDYESITVLKGAAATSLYGSRGANGAIVITTKRGKSRTGLGIEVSYTHEFQQTYGAPYRLQNEFGMGSPYNNYEGEINPAWESTASSFNSSSFGPRMEGQMMKQYYKGTTVGAEPLNPQPDNWKALFQVGQYDNVSAAITGGSENVTYRLSYGFTKLNGVMKNNSFNRHSINFSTTGKINEILSVDASVQYTKSNTLNPQFSSPDAWGWSPTMILGFYNPRNVDLGWVMDNYIDPVTYERRAIPFVGDGNNFSRYINDKADNNTTREEQTIIARLALNANFTDWLDASVSVSYNDFNRFSETKNYGSGKYRDGGEYSISGGHNGQYNGLAQIHYNQRFLDDRFEVDARVMSEIYGGTRSTSYTRRTNGLKYPGVFSFANTKNVETIDQREVKMTPRNDMTIGLAAILNLSWADQVYLELTARNDWVSSLLYPAWLPAGANNYSVFYPSANASWVFSETFKIDPSILSFGKIRASIAQVGMGTGAYQTADGAGGYNTKGVNAPSGSVQYATPRNTTLPNLDLKPEIQQSIEFGADLRFLNDRLGIDVTYYKTNTYNQIMTVASAVENGSENRLINAGNIQNQGWEIQLDATPIETRDWRWTVSANWTRNRGKVVELHPEVKDVTFFGGIWRTPTIRAFEGGPFGEVVAGNGYGGSGLVKARQNDPTKPGYGKYLLKNINPSGSAPAPVERYAYVNTGEISGYYNDDYKYDVLGNIQPDFLWGFNTSLTWKGFNLFVQIDGRQGGSVISPVMAYAHQTGSTYASLPGREGHGGVARENYKGEIKYDGMIIDGVFRDGQKVKNWKTGESVDAGGKTMQELCDANIIQPMPTTAFYASNSAYADNQVYDLDYVALREVSLGYNFPEKWIKHIGMQALRFEFSMRNLCYIYNGSFSGANPESISNNNPLSPYDNSGVPFTRTFSLKLNVRF